MMTANLPQLEDGYVRIANELYDAVLRFGFTGRQMHVLFAVIRKTYGYGKTTDDVSASQIGDICGMSRSHVTSTLNQLASMKVINKQPGVYGSIVSVNKDYRSWASADGQPKPSTKSVQVDSTESVQVSQNGTSTKSVQGVPKKDFASTKSVQVDSTESVHTKDNLPKDNIQKNCTEELSLSIQDESREPTPIAQLPLVDGSEHAVFEDQASEWRLAYPAVDILQELVRMRVWLNANPRKRKTKRGINAFIANWLMRTQDRPRRDGPANAGNHHADSGSQPWDLAI